MNSQTFRTVLLLVYLKRLLAIHHYSATRSHCPVT